MDLALPLRPGRWPWAWIRIGERLVPSFLALGLAGTVLAAMTVAAAAVLLERSPALPLALSWIGAVILLGLGLLRRHRQGVERHAVLPNLLLLLTTWAALLALARLPVLPTLDLLALGLAVQIGVGRLGCTLAGCCYGLPASWGLVHSPACGSPPAGVRRLPVALLEAGGWSVIAAAIAFALATAPAGSGLSLLLLLYGLLRTALEPLRGDPVRRWWGLRPALLLAGLSIGIGASLAQVLSDRVDSPAGVAPQAGTQPEELMLVGLGLVCLLLLALRRDLWCSGVQVLPAERRDGLIRFGHQLLRTPPSRAVQVHHLGDLQLGVSRHGHGSVQELQLSVRRTDPPLSWAEAEWILEAIASGLGRLSTGPIRTLIGEGPVYLARLPFPMSGQVPAADPDEPPDYFTPLIPQEVSSPWMRL